MMRNLRTSPKGALRHDGAGGHGSRSPRSRWSQAHFSHSYATSSGRGARGLTPRRRDRRSKLSRSPRARERGLPAGFCLERVAAPFFCFTAPSPIGSSWWSVCDSRGAPATRCWRSIFKRTVKAPAIESRWVSSNPWTRGLGSSGSARRLPGEPVAVLGISMGGAATLIGQPIEADAVIVESVALDFVAAVSNRLALGSAPSPGSLRHSCWARCASPAELRPRSCVQSRE